MKQLKAGIFLSYINILVTNVVGILIVPFIVKQLGDSEYGLYMLIGSFVSYFSLMDLGMNKTITRYVSKYLVQNRKDEETKFLSTISRFYMVISFIVVLVGIILYFNLDYIFKNSLNTDELSEAKKMFLLLIISVSITLPGRAFDAIVLAYEKFIFLQSVKILRYIIRVILIIVFLLNKPYAFTIVKIDFAVNIFYILALFFYVSSKLNIRISLKYFDWKVLRKIFTYSIWIFLFALYNNFQWRSGQIALGVLVNTKVVAVFSIGVMLGTYYGTFASVISNLLLPKATKMAHDNSSIDDINHTFIKVANVIISILYLILGGFILLGKDFILLWVGDKYIYSWRVAIIIMLVITIPLSEGFAGNLLEAKKILSFKVSTAIISVIVGLIIGSLLVKVNSVLGMIAGLMVGRVIYEILLNFYYHRKLKLDMIHFFRVVYLKKTLVFILVLSISYFLMSLISGNSIKIFLIKSSLYTLIYIFVFYFFAISKYEKQLISNIFLNNLKI